MAIIIIIHLWAVTSLLFCVPYQLSSSLLPISVGSCFSYLLPKRFHFSRHPPAIQAGAIL